MSDPATLHQDSHRAFAFIIGTNGFADFHPDRLISITQPWGYQSKGLEGSFTCNGTYEPESYDVVVQP